MISRTITILQTFVSLVMMAAIWPANAELIDSGSIVTACQNGAGRVTYRDYSLGCNRNERLVGHFTKAFGECPCWTKEQISETEWDSCQTSSTPRAYFALIGVNGDDFSRARFASNGKECRLVLNGNSGTEDNTVLFITEPEWRACVKDQLDAVEEQSLICSEL